MKNINASQTEADLYLTSNPDVHRYGMLEVTAIHGATVKDCDSPNCSFPCERVFTFGDKSTITVDLAHGWASIKRDLRSFTMVGGYPVFYLTSEDGVLCPECAATNDEPTTPHVNYESRMSCDECSTEIEAAYDIVE